MNNTNESRIEKIKGMLSKQGEDCFLLHALGLEYLKIGDEKTAIEQFEQVLSINEQYVGTYYHLALAVAKENEDQAKAIFLKGIQVAEAVKDQHAKNELQMMYDEMYEEW